MEKELKVDIGFGREEYIIVPLNATIETIKEECIKQTGEHLFCVKASYPIEEVKYNEY